MKNLSPKKLMLLAAGVFLLQAGGCIVTNALGGLLGGLIPGA
jgi:hypothetical protein